MGLAGTVSRSAGQKKKTEIFMMHDWVAGRGKASTFRQKSESLAGALFLARLAILLNTFNGHVNSHDSLRQTRVTVSDGQTNFQIVFQI